jgi:DNA-binding transcriptional regulator YhcF (GntR family)
VTVMATAPTADRTDPENAQAELDADYTPGYIQIARLVYTRINDGIYPRWSCIPGSRALAREFGVSQVVALHGLTVLVRAGYLRHVESKPHQVVWDAPVQATETERSALCVWSLPSKMAVRSARRTTREPKTRSWTQ